MKIRIHSLILFLCILTCSLLLHAELLIMKQTNNGLAVLDESDPNMPKIEEIILKYQWPMSAACALDPNEIKQKILDETGNLFTAGIPNAEELFIEKKIQEITGDKNYRVVFFPTTLYELFVTRQALQEVNQVTPLINAVNILKTKYEFVRIGNMLNNQNPTAVKKQIKDYYAAINGIFLNATLNNAYAYINSKIGVWLLNQHAAIKTAKEPTAIIKQEFSSLSATLIADLVPLIPNISKTPLFNHYYKKLTGEVFEEILTPNVNIKTSHFYTIVNKYIDLEYDARNVNNGILIRGTKLIELNDQFTSVQKKPHEMLTNVQKPRELPTKFLIGSTISFDSLGTMPLIEAYKQKKLEPYSISFGNSLFGGILRDYTACAFYYLNKYNIHLTQPTGYMLFIDKKQYIDNQNNKLFFIPPLATIVSIFARGEFFHPRTNVAIPEPQLVKIKSIEDIDINTTTDPTQFLIMVQDPFEYAALFSDFIADNMHIFTYNERQIEVASEVKKTQHEVAKYFRDIIAEVRSTTSPESFGLRALKEKQEEIARQQLKEAKRKQEQQKNK